MTANSWRSSIHLSPVALVTVKSVRAMWVKLRAMWVKLRTLSCRYPALATPSCMHQLVADVVSLSQVRRGLCCLSWHQPQ